eukprot:Sdes_comp19719_c0_seq1m11670
MPILDAPPNSSRVIWTSSSAAQEKSFNLNDIQCLKGKNMYASSKYAVDILCLALNDIALKSNKKVKFYSTCPGYCLSGMTESLLPSFVWSLFLLFFMFLRIFTGFFTIDCSHGAEALLYLALTADQDLDVKYKYLSEITFWGSRYVNRKLLPNRLEESHQLLGKLNLILKDFRKISESRTKME